MLKSIPWDGKKITKPGMYVGIPNAEYHGDICDGPSISTTGLKKIFSQSPADYFLTSYLNPEHEDEDKDESSALIMGRAVHHLILGEKNFAKTFAIQPATYTDPKTSEEKKWHGGANVCKQWDVEQAEANRYVLHGKEVEHIRGMAKSLGTNELVRAGVLDGLIERSLFWKDKKTGVWLKQRPDVIPAASGDVVDLKTASSVVWDDLERGHYKFGYFQQGALAREGLRTVLGMEVADFMLFYIQSKPPYSARPIIVKPIDLDFGDVSNRAALDTFAACLKSGVWPGPGSLAGHIAEHMELTVWQKRRLTLQLKLMGYETPDFEGKETS